MRIYNHLLGKTKIDEAGLRNDYVHVEYDDLNNFAEFDTDFINCNLFNHEIGVVVIVL